MSGTFEGPKEQVFGRKQETDPERKLEAHIIRELGYLSSFLESVHHDEIDRIIRDLQDGDRKVDVKGASRSLEAMKEYANTLEFHDRIDSITEHIRDLARQFSEK